MCVEWVLRALTVTVETWEQGWNSSVNSVSWSMECVCVLSFLLVVYDARTLLLSKSSLPACIWGRRSLRPVERVSESLCSASEKYPSVSVSNSVASFPGRGGSLSGRSAGSTTPPAPVPPLPRALHWRVRRSRRGKRGATHPVSGGAVPGLETCVGEIGKSVA